ncbi:LysM peptidoglycan-binding domain-containing protein [Methylococcus geothermalis]|uniref:LysM peptidoglycan-binding domain-containing protein n=1 Tax=Methylococcus geothermalis TaxID=2681310 RepID=A0A858Q5R4_9GAMM|nr:LysM peptidoglycan-binding domain-containing protein [Methylococcus geothermalis]QJD29145.1 LysM peptidoglycan-binding domain-containing protein [Methylococcus geothermalis]
MIAKFAVGLALLFVCAGTWAAGIALNPDHPERYLVAPNDTIWDVASRFLKNPAQWSEVWYRNPALGNPDQIYPGDVLVLRWVAGRPRIELETAAAVPLNPVIRVTPLVREIPAIPADAIRAFLTRPRVLDSSDVDALPYIVGFPDEHISGGAGYGIYARGLKEAKDTILTVVRPGPAYRDGATEEVLGYEALYIGDAQVRIAGEPSELLLVRAEREAVIGDRLLAVEPHELATSYTLHAPEKPVAGRIIGVLDGVTQIGQYQVIVLDRGTRDGLEVGHVLDIHREADTIKDYVAGGFGNVVETPPEWSGSLVVFRPFDRVSYALVMKAVRAMHIGDIVRSP